jgi:rhomboid protease GluP
VAQGAARGRWALLSGVALAWCAVYAAAAWPRLGAPLSAPALLAYGALYTPLPAAQWPRLFTTWLVHVDPLHLLGNLAAWLVSGLPFAAPRRDRAVSRLVALGTCGLGASLASVLFYGQRPVISAGPSGALLGLLVVALVQGPAARRVRAAWLLFATALLVGGALSGGDTAAHAGGALTGLGLGWYWRIRR